jgi:hypothetical protein
MLYVRLSRLTERRTAHVLQHRRQVDSYSFMINKPERVRKARLTASLLTRRGEKSRKELSPKVSVRICINHKRTTHVVQHRQATMLKYFHVPSRSPKPTRPEKVRKARLTRFGLTSASYLAGWTSTMLTTLGEVGSEVHRAEWD